MQAIGPALALGTSLPAFALLEASFVAAAVVVALARAEHGGKFGVPVTF